MDDLLDLSHLGLSTTTASPVMWRLDAGSKCKCMSKPSGRIWYPLTLRASPTRFTDSPPTATAITSGPLQLGQPTRCTGGQGQLCHSVKHELTLYT